MHHSAFEGTSEDHRGQRLYLGYEDRGESCWRQAVSYLPASSTPHSLSMYALGAIYIGCAWAGISLDTESGGE